MDFPDGYLKLDGDIKCEICSKILPVHRFTNHPLMAHKIKIKDYYDKYLRKENEGICVCGNPTVFFSLMNGYRQFCSVRCLNKNIKLVTGRSIISHNQFICKLCNKGFRTINCLSKHLSIVHKQNNKDYYDKYLKKENEGICKICNKPTRYYNMGKGYNLYCCNSCGSKDPDVQIKNKQTYFKKTGYECALQNPLLIKQRVIKNKKKRVDKGDWLSDDKIPLYHLYYRKVGTYTNISMKKKYTKEELKKRTACGVDGGLQLDHKFSVVEGFKNNILPCIIGSISNLELIPWLENNKKDSDCSITKEQLFELYEKEMVGDT